MESVCDKFENEIVSKISDNNDKGCKEKVSEEEVLMSKNHGK